MMLPDFANQTMQQFKQLCAIPHCSFHTQDMFSYLCATLKDKGYEIQTDEAKNIYAKKGNPRVCLQSHYDMVCVGESSNHQGLQVCEEGDVLRAHNSSLGADNGVGVASMLALDVADIELLFTNDEEVGMIGANHLKLPIQSHLLLNLDSEDINDIVVGCAGGVDIECDIPLQPFSQDISLALTTHPYIYHIVSEGFLGGHSGIEIHKNKDNPIVEWGFWLDQNQSYIVSIKAGEKRNSIPTHLESVILSPQPLPNSYSTLSGNARFIITPLAQDSIKNFSYAYHQNIIIPLLVGLHSGVYAFNSQGTLASLNLSLLEQNTNHLSLVMMARANSDAMLLRLIQHIKSTATNLNPQCKVQDKGFYSAWERSIADNHPALTLLYELYAKHSIQPKITQIHAGLEGGILKKNLLAAGSKAPLDVLSIGPTIHSPHSVNECVEIKSFNIFCEILHDFVQSYQ